jgi:hypothetical protein
MKYSQKDLLNEGFWAGFTSRKNNQPNQNKKPGIMHNLGKAARWGVRAAAKTMDYVAPEITQPIHKFEAATRNILGLKPADQNKWNQNLQASGGTVNYQGRQYLIDIAKGVTPTRSGRYVVKANEVNTNGKKSHKIVSMELDKDFNVYGIR